ncbi:lipoyltransferase [Nadsonia fulvescens var. elongata DSM 6958]|uniref:lipoyl(octanoyl) transferase n=1 Tax=Nadsonia fulvescens var. elongata DSM 6958 TaxID=857566 RepID=A0A1E3PQ83_9ASCO|nr:lipoyltransferase [Nadsonia fulvescens var. elongata DSM 6958]
MLDFKSQASKISHESDPLSRPTPVPPVILTFQMHPVFTLGRRGNGKSRFGDRPPEGTDALVIETLRGGQTTFHGPGQLVSYPIVDLLTHFKPFEETTGSGLTSSTKLPVRCYVSLLEKTIIQLLDTYHDVTAMTTDNTGVWVNENDKIAAIGVHVRRNVTSHGIALNVSTDIEWFKKVVACGLKDKNMVTLQMVLDKLGRNWSEESVNVNVLAKQWSRELSKSFGWDMEYIEADPKDYLKH